MSNILPVELPSGEQILARVGVDGPSDVASMPSLHRLSSGEFRQTVEGVARSVAAAIERVAPNEVSVEFGIELSVKAGKVVSVLADAGGKASLKITLTWNA